MKIADNTKSDIAGSEFHSVSQAKAIEQAASAGLEIVKPGPRELQIDIDSDADLHKFYEQLMVFNQKFPLMRTKVFPSKSGGERKHITITLDREVTPELRILLQACLGSDRKRELLSYFRLMNGEKDPTLFFERPRVQPVDDGGPLG